ncbi:MULTISPECIES: fimbrial protein [unclassified Serratia (in: enterobacteria)]|uniref:fimbrial protein n=1 Tax=unclassified Serratia (in: enterobacteria) TaxID=2647522 RepID=UPI0027ED272A|nr:MULTISPECIES: fimbrial protein [unclassified Serratia (in: enterobacteria)]MDQ7099071.1 fimbrial protein [Serratia sp. MF2]MDQ7105577.1 fimbrial protein [Serratia sp. MF1(2023)]
MIKYLSTLCLLPLLVGSTYATDSSITITGYLKDGACSVAVDSQDFTVDLMSNVAKQLDHVGAVTPTIPFKIVFDKCDSSVIAVKIGYVGVSDDDVKELLRTDSGDNAASGVGIQILDNNKTPIPLNAAQSSLNWTTLTPSQSNTVGFHARLMATRFPVTAGNISATANFTLEFQ